MDRFRQFATAALSARSLAMFSNNSTVGMATSTSEASPTRRNRVRANLISDVLPIESLRRGQSLSRIISYRPSQARR